jgi:hypothetical protein
MGPARIQFTPSSQRGKKEGWKCKMPNAECKMGSGATARRNRALPGGWRVRADLD